ncbi:MAG: LysR family transcriptional regulator [Formivibrio sp.]|nr:LysR family transcriptional regulator [Formivibrio sp.]
MHIDWFEDFVCLVETHSFSLAAQQLKISQPALSRRIQALEEWLGAPLIDRSSQGVRLTPAGRTFHTFAIDTVHRAHDMRAILRGHAPADGDSIHFAVAHTLSLTYFPGWLKQLKARFPSIVSRVSAVNVQDGVAALTRGDSDFLITYHHPQMPIIRTSKGTPFLELGTDRVVPYSGVNSEGKALFELPGNPHERFPFLAYEAGAYLAYIVELILLSAGRPCHLRRSFETHMAESLKAMIVAGHGIGWLPESCAIREVHDGQLIQAGDDNWTTAINVRIYRQIDNNKPIVDRIWQDLSDSS